MPDTAPDPEQSWLRDGRKRLVYDALRRLNGPNREMILPREIQGLQLKEIAEMLGLPIGTVKSRSNRARRRVPPVPRALRTDARRPREPG